MNSAEEPSVLLARRLRSLRKKGLSGGQITQEQLAEAFDVSTPLISSWERLADPVLPPLPRIEAYATFFATARSVARRPYRLVTDLTAEEQAGRDVLLRELSDLRDRVLGEVPASSAAAVADDLWRFPLDQDITIVCSELPPQKLQDLPYSSPEDPDYVELYRYADLDALLELYGHLRAVNPQSKVRVRGPSTFVPDDYTSHLVLLGGVDFNQVTADVLKKVARKVALPVRQLERADDADPGAFEVVESGRRKQFRPNLTKEEDGKDVLEEDVAHFCRALNPYNRARTVTICNGMYQRGTLGAVLALTDPRFRDGNHAYVRTRFEGKDTFSILSRVSMVPGKATPPDWQNPDDRLHEWTTETS